MGFKASHTEKTLTRAKGPPRDTERPQAQEALREE